MKQNNLNQKGVVSLIVCLIMMIVISLFSIGYIQLSDNEQKSALSNQLSQAAYYAAESGINNVKSYINTLLPNHIDQLRPNPASCTPNIPGYSSAINTTNNFPVYHSCVTVNSSPNKLPYTISAGTSRVIPINTAFSSLTLNWTEQGSNGGYDGCKSGNFVSKDAADCSASALQIDISTNNLASPPNSFYLNPIKCEGSYCANNFSSIRNFQDVKCVKNSSCSVTLTSGIGLPNAPFYIKIMPIYGSNTSLTVTADNGSYAFTGAEVQVTSTGKAQGVVQAITAYIDITGNTGDSPVFAIQTQKDLCDELQGYAIPGNSDYKQNNNCSLVQ